MDDQLVFHGMVGHSRPIRSIIKKINQVAPLDIPVLISGESGTGKELVARAIHHESGRKQGPFHPVNTGAIPPELIASELFGHERGAFTGATAARDGVFQAARGGTLFLDEIGSMSPDLQVSLLRVLETRKFTRIGGSNHIEADVRLLAATSSNLKAAIKAKEFRSDLFYRLSVYSLPVPPLRKRRGDIPTLVHHFLSEHARQYGPRIREVTASAMRRLVAYHWPGNVRELSNVVTRLVVSAPGDVVNEEQVIAALDSVAVVGDAEGDPLPWPDESAGSTGDSAPATGDRDGRVLHPGLSIQDAERELIRITLVHTGGNRTRAAKLLGISRKSLYNKMNVYELGDE